MVSISSIITDDSEGLVPNSSVNADNSGSGKGKDIMGNEGKGKKMDGSIDNDGYGDLSSPGSDDFEQWVLYDCQMNPSSNDANRL